MSRTATHRSVGSRLALGALATALAVSLVLAVAVAILAQRTEMRRVDEALRMVEQVHLASLTEELWQFSPRIRQDVASVLTLPHVERAVLELPSGKRIAAGAATGQETLARSFPIEHPVGGRLGILRVDLATGSIRSAAVRQALLLTLALTLPIAVTALAIVLLFRRLVGRHLDDLATSSEAITLDTLGQDFHLRRPYRSGDELDRLTDALARMRGNLREEMASRRRTEDQLSASEERYREVFDAVGDALFIHDAGSGEVLEVNRSACELYRLDQARLIAASSLGTISLGEAPYDLPHARELMRRTDAGPQTFEWRARDGAGRVFWVDVCLKQVSIAGCTRIIASVRDIDARKQAEEQIRHFQRLESIGQLAGGIAHDFNNLLAGIIGSLELALRRLSPQHDCRRYLDIAMQAGHRAADLNRKLLTFARRNPQQVVTLDLHATIDGTIALLERAIPPSLRIVRRLEATRTTVRADATELQNALLNLCINARDAMPDGGTITLATADADLDQAGCERFSGFTVQPGPHVAISVSDTGCGIPAAIRPRIFEPFFTTKEIGKGTGLGLSAVFGAVSAMGGAIAVESTVGAGSCFTLVLPLASGPVAAPAVLHPLPRRDLGVLVVDDDEIPRRMSAEMLAELGCRVFTADSGAAALAELQGRGTAITVVLLDLVMPGMSGTECFAAIRALRPDCRIVLCSGFVRDTAVAGLVAAGNVCFLAKPYSIGELAAALTAETAG